LFKWKGAIPEGLQADSALEYFEGLLRVFIITVIIEYRWCECRISWSSMASFGL